jgi:hypothetical protein
MILCLLHYIYALTDPTQLAARAPASADGREWATRRQKGREGDDAASPIKKWWGGVEFCEFCDIMEGGGGYDEGDHCPSRR